VELAIAVVTNVTVVPVQVDNEFRYPDESFYAAIREGRILFAFDRGRVERRLEAVEGILRAVFQDTSVRFDANSSAAQIALSLDTIAQRHKTCAEVATAGHLYVRLHSSGLLPEVAKIAEAEPEEEIVRHGSWLSETRLNACANGVPAVTAWQLFETMKSQELTPNVIAYKFGDQCLLKWRACR
jgi:hypothetical protein